jgi:predicted nucleotide-binding protein (sugar kinase/HSP70/actin superfamily)
MGNLDLVLKDLFNRSGLPYLIPPKTTTRTLQLGLRYSPEFACLPLKVTIGNFIEAIEEGADTLLMAGGIGPCRFGYYAEIQKFILKALGYNFEMIVLEPPRAGLLLFIKTLKKLAPGKSIWEIRRIIKVGFKKARVFDEVEREVLKYRAYEVKRGETTKAYRKALAILDKAFTEEEIEQARKEALDLIHSVEKDMDKPCLKVGIVGEFYVLLEPFVNFDVEEYLGHSGVSLERSVYLTDWISPSKDNVIMGIPYKEIVKAAKPYLNHFVGGEGLPSVGHTVIYAKEGFDGVLHLFPFTCMPDTIAKSILPKVSSDYDIPVLSLVLDEQTGKAGMVTRLEAFMDLMWSKRKQRIKATKPVKR